MSLSKDALAKQITTLDATPTNVTDAAVTLGDNKEATFGVHALAKSGSSIKGFRIWGVGKRAAAGSASIVGSIINQDVPQGDSTLADAFISVVASGNDLIPRVTGIGATSIIWDIWFEVYRTL